MTFRLSALCFKASDPLRLANFWAVALDQKVQNDNNGTIRLTPADELLFDIIFRPSSEEKAGKNPIHIDISTKSLDDQKETVRKLVEHGARHIDIGQSSDQPHVVLADPEGNEFCVVGPDNTFVDKRGRLGSITCDGSRKAGLFWSHVFGWPLVWDEDGETAIRAPDSTGPFVTWGPPVPLNKTCRLYLEMALPEGSDRQAEVDRLVSLGAHPINTNDKNNTNKMIMTDPDGTQFILI